MPDEVDLIRALEVAHQKSVARDSISTTALKLATFGSGDACKSIASCILTLGGVHGPILQAYDLLNSEHPDDIVTAALESKKRVPGWGNSFAKDAIDPLWVEVHSLVSEGCGGTINAITNRLHSEGLKLYPNPACYTAACAIILGVPRDAAPCLFIASRLETWMAMFIEVSQQTPEIA